MGRKCLRVKELKRVRNFLAKLKGKCETRKVSEQRGLFAPSKTGRSKPTLKNSELNCRFTVLVQSSSFRPNLR